MCKYDPYYTIPAPNWKATQNAKTEFHFFRVNSHELFFKMPPASSEDNTARVNFTFLPDEVVFTYKPNPRVSNIPRQIGLLRWVGKLMRSPRLSVYPWICRFLFNRSKVPFVTSLAHSLHPDCHHCMYIMCMFVKLSVHKLGFSCEVVSGQPTNNFFAEVVSR